VGLLLATANGAVSAWTLAAPGGLAIAAGVYALAVALK
jgi:hypothetical protein